MKVHYDFKQHGLQMDHELVVDNFAGGGGASTGIEAAIGRSVDVAINHDALALSMHEANHPHTKHFKSDVFKVDPLTVTGGRPVGLAWFSPDCKHFSKAKGGKPVDKKIRGLAWIVVKWAEKTKFRVGILENVEEFKGWGPLKRGADGKMYPDPKKQGFTFRRWWRELERLGYHLEMRELRVCDYGIPTIRKRLFIVMRRDGLPVVWRSPTHGKGLKQKQRPVSECIDWSLPCPSIFLTKSDVKKMKLKVRRPLKPATMRRIARGVMRYIIDNPHPFIVPVKSWGGGGNDARSTEEPLRTTTASKRGEYALVTPFLTEHANASAQRNFQAGEPLRTQCGEVKGGHFALIAPTLMVNTTGHAASAVTNPAPTVTTGGQHMLVSAGLVTTGHGEREGQLPRGRSVMEPLGTVVASANNHAQVVAFLAQHNTGVVGHPATKPLSTITQRGTQQQVVAASLMKLKGTSKDGQPVDEPLHTVQAGGNHYAEVCAFLVKYYGCERDRQDIKKPLGTITTKDRYALALVVIDGVEYQIVDIGMRMLTPRELFRAQGFPEEYIINPYVDVWSDHRKKMVHRRLTKTEQIRMCGNSVPPGIAAILVEDNYLQRAAEAKTA